MNVPLAAHRQVGAPHPNLETSPILAAHSAPSDACTSPVISGHEPLPGSLAPCP